MASNALSTAEMSASKSMSGRGRGVAVLGGGCRCDRGSHSKKKKNLIQQIKSTKMIIKKLKQKREETNVNFQIDSRKRMKQWK